MPNGGGDCCGLCQFGIQPSREDARFRCEIRDIDIPDPYWTYCVNHELYNPHGWKVPIGPVEVIDESTISSTVYDRTVWLEAQDSPEIRSEIVRVASAIAEAPETGWIYGSRLLRQGVDWEIKELAVPLRVMADDPTHPMTELARTSLGLLGDIQDS